MANRFAKIALLLALFFLTTASSLKQDEKAVIFPSFAYLEEGQTTVKVPLRVWVYEPETDSGFRTEGIGALRRALGLPEEAAETEEFRRRARMFLVDNERGKKISVELAGKQFDLPRTNRSGHASDQIEIAASELEANSVAAGKRRWVAAKIPDSRAPAGAEIEILSARGISVISDIDDTIKVSEVHNKRALLENTFVKPFRPADGMADLYRRFEEEGASFHYVSSSPWQLFPFLANFVRDHRYPAGSFHLKMFRFKDESFFNLFRSPIESKREIIEPMLRRMKGRSFVLIGDSGEKDPEIYGILAREFPEQVRAILIRAVASSPEDASRYREAFAGIAAEKCQVFRSPSEVDFAALLKRIQSALPIDLPAGSGN